MNAIFAQSLEAIDTKRRRVALVGGPMPEVGTASAVAKMATMRARGGPTTTKQLEERVAQKVRTNATTQVQTRGVAGMGMRLATRAPEIPPKLLEAIVDVMKTPHDVCYYLKLVENMIADGWKSYSEIRRVVAEQVPNKKGIFHHSMPMNWRKMLCVFLFGNGEGGMPKGRDNGGRNDHNGGKGPSQDVGQTGGRGLPPEEMALPHRLFTTLAGAPDIISFCDSWGERNGEKFGRNTSMGLIAEYEERYGVVCLE